MLTDTEIDKLQKTDSARDKANDFIVRTKLKKWLDGLFVVSVIILHYLPEKQLAKIVKYDHVNYLSNILTRFLWTAGAVPITKKNEYEYMAILPDGKQRYAEPDEIRLNGLIKLMINNLFQALSAEDVREVIKKEIDFHQPDYTLVKKA